MKAGRQFATVAAALILVVRIDASENLNKVWEFKVASALRNNSAGGSNERLGIFALSFSPDAHRLAAAVGRSLSDESLLIIDTNKPREDSHMVDFNSKGSEHVVSTELSWSASGQQILLGRKKIQLSNQSTCTFPEKALLPPFVFAKGALIAARQSPLVFSESGTLLDGQYKPMRLSEFDLDCRLTGEVDLSSDAWSIYDASSERGILLLYWQQQRAKSSIEWALSLLDVVTGTVLRKFPLLERAKFADSGKIVCGVAGEEWHRAVECVDADNGTELAITKGWRNPYIDTARSARRAILSDFNRKFDWSDLVWREGGSLRKRIIWDFGTGQVLATLRAKFPKVPYGASHEFGYQYAISPDGKYVAEGGEGMVTLYRIGS